MKESLKANGWALNTEYFGEIMHYLRDELAYRAVVDQLLQLPKNSATRDTEAIKRICTGYLKLLFPNATDVSKVDVSLFETYCLAPAMEMRRVIKTQLGIIDEGEFGGMTIPEITIKEQYRENEKCKLCGTELKKDWIALHRKLLDIDAKEFCVFRVWQIPLGVMLKTLR